MDDYFTIEDVVSTEEEEKKLEEGYKFLGIEAVFPPFVNPYEEKLKNVKQVKNYKELCKILGEEIKINKTKDIQLKKWSEYFTWKKDGQNFTKIKLLTEEEHNKVVIQIKEKKINNKIKNEAFFIREKRILGLYADEFEDYKNLSENKKLKQRYEDIYKRGVYKIQLDNQVYIGSTTISFFNRINQHLLPNNTLPTYDMFQQGATFSICWFANENNTKKEILTKETEYYCKYKNLGYDMINYHTPYNPCTSIKILKSEKEQIIQLLKDNSFTLFINENEDNENEDNENENDNEDNENENDIDGEDELYE